MSNQMKSNAVNERLKYYEENINISNLVCMVQVLPSTNALTLKL